MCQFRAVTVLLLYIPTRACAHTQFARYEIVTKLYAQNLFFAMFMATMSLKTLFGTKVHIRKMIQLKFLVNAVNDLVGRCYVDFNEHPRMVCVRVLGDMKVNINICQSSFFLPLVLTQKQYSK